MPFMSNDPKKIVLREHGGAVAANVTAVVVIYNSGEDAISAVSSLICGYVCPRRIVLVDNASTDSSFQNVQSYMRGLNVNQQCKLPFAATRIESPIESERKIYCESIEDHVMSVLYGNDTPGSVKITLIKSDVNGGFAAGNNVALRWISLREHEGFIWLVNSDAYVAPDCLAELSSVSETAGLEQIFGTVLVDYTDCSTVQACGGSINPVFLSSAGNHVGERLASLQAATSRYLADYPIGASLFFWFSKKTGSVFLEEDYFLYYEELDLVSQAGLKNVPIYTKAVVAHRGGASILDSGTYSSTSDYYSTRARILFAFKYRPIKIASAFFYGLAIALKRALFGARGAWVPAATGALDGLRRRTGIRGAQ